MRAGRRRHGEAVCGHSREPRRDIRHPGPLCPPLPGDGAEARLGGVCGLRRGGPALRDGTGGTAAGDPRPATRYQVMARCGGAGLCSVH